MNFNIITLDEAPIKCKVKTLKITSKGLLRQRMLDLGIVPDTVIEVIRRSPLGDPTAYLIRGCLIALRKDEAKYIYVHILENYK